MKKIDEETKFTLTIEQLRQLVNEAAAQPPAQQQQADPNVQKEAEALKGPLNSFISNLLSVFKSPEALKAFLKRIVDTDDGQEVQSEVQQAQKEAQQGEQAAAQVAASQGNQPAQQTTEDSEQDFSDASPETVAQYVFDHYEEISGISKSDVYEYMLTKDHRGERKLDLACKEIKSFLKSSGVPKDDMLFVFDELDRIFIDNPPEDIDESWLNQIRSKFMGAGAAAKAAVTNIGNKMAGNKDAQKQSIRGANQTAKFGELIRQYIVKFQNFAAQVQKYSQSTKDPNEQAKAKEMIEKIQAFSAAANNALTQTQNELKSAGYDRKQQAPAAKQAAAPQAGQKAAAQPAAAPAADTKQQEPPKQEEPKQEQPKQEPKQEEPKKEEPKQEEPKKDDKKDSDAEMYDQLDDFGVGESTKFTLTVGQLKKLVKEASESHVYQIWYDEDELGEPQDEIEFPSREQAFAYIADEVSKTGTFPTDITEDGVSVIDEFDNWCETVDEGAWDFIKKVGQGIGKSVKQGAVNTWNTMKGASRELAAGAADRFNNYSAGKGFTATVNTTTLADKLSRIVGELEMDLKDMYWSEKQNPQLAKVIKDLEVSANEIHGKGEKGSTTDLDKLLHGAGKLAGAAAMGAVTAIGIGMLTKPLRAFMSPRAHAALVAAATVLLRALMRNMERMDTKEDEKAQAAQTPPAQPAAPTNEGVMSDIQKGDISKYITATDVAAAVTAGVIAYIRNSSSEGAEQATPDPTNLQECQADFNSAMKAGRLFKQTNGYWTQYDDDGKAIGVFRQVRGGLCRYEVNGDGTITAGTFFKSDGTTQALQDLTGPNRAVQVWTNHHNTIANQLQSGKILCDPYTTTVGQDPDFDKSLMDSLVKKINVSMKDGGFQIETSDRIEALDMIMDYADTNDLTQAQVSSMVTKLGPMGLAKLAQLDDTGKLVDTDAILKSLAGGSTKALDQAWGTRMMAGTFQGGANNWNMDF